ncbi:LLM class flavin-dependent oxidoreductase [Flavobacterium sp. F52]|uniref:LLM class flavin-dependent oxidoreductase n=1 Tax=Flavobacterium sp. F52 TaxID=1202532 RepID=UPI000272D85E|nr:LLM class flavin-dependent oxidoreductase [Flavobacterium sp. F52]EJG03165.1 luciferase family protein [Flavobacterium sp. F52]
MKNKFEFGFYTFGNIIPDPITGEKTSQHQRVKEIIEAAKLADQAGFDVIGIGEHHTSDFVLSAPIVLLSAIAQATKNIKLSTAVAVLSTHDPVRLYEEFATLDLVSDGRAEILVGRGSTTESFPLFGYNLTDYDALFSEKLELLKILNQNEVVNWKGKFRSALVNAEIEPRPLAELPIWVGVGGTIASAARAGAAGANLNLAILGGAPERFKHLVDIYREAAEKSGHDAEKLKVAVSSHSYVAENGVQARNEIYPTFSHTMKYLIKKLRGQDYNISRNDFELMTGSDTALTIGSPQEMIDKIMHQYELFHHDRYILQLDMNGLPFNQLSKAIELVADRVAPVVRKEIEGK